ncbi:MAG: universal stress protein [Henriciella sp.]|uniref:universal stress protein n=1 Tax=Henriciella sp. TaxID=1968823 RepID=UPI0032EBF6DA
MTVFKNISLVCDGLSDETDSFRQALSQTRANKADLNVLLLPPKLPASYGTHQEKFQSALMEGVKETLSTVAGELDIELGSFPITYATEVGSRSSVHIVRDCLRHQRDLVIKQAISASERPGFHAADVELLRKCPAPVWLCRPIMKHRNEIQVAVAVDPEHEDTPTRDLVIRMVNLARRIAEQCNGTLMVISAWDFPFERELSTNPFLPMMPAEDITAQVNRSRDEHRAKLDTLLSEAGASEVAVVKHARGQPDNVVPAQAEADGVDILVMGTVARAHLAGLLIGNTAENVLHKLSCSLLALKPSNFVSPISAYD